MQTSGCIDVITGSRSIALSLAFLISLQGFPLIALADEVAPSAQTFATSTLSIPTTATTTVSDTNSTPPATVVALSDVASSEATSADEESCNDEDSDENNDCEEEDIDLGDNHAEMDAQKDMTGVVRQSKDYYCGPASLATLLTQLGDDTSESEVLEHIVEADLVPNKGTNLLALKVAAQKLGSQVYLKKWTAEQVLAYIKATDDPVLIHDEKKGVGGHFSVIRDYDAEKGIVELSDTEAGNIKYSVKDFEHIYTGYVLVVSSDASDTLLADKTTDVSDDVAALIWGMYVPVNVLAAMNSSTQAAATAFAKCTREALALATAKMRIAKRQGCYADLAKGIGSALSNTGELAFVTAYNAAYYTTPTFENYDRNGQLGTNSIVSALNAKLAESKAKLTTLQSQLDQKKKSLALGDATKYALKLSVQKSIDSKTIAITNATSQKSLLDASLTPKSKTLSTLQSELNSGSFSQNGQTFSLGAVGNQVTAQSSTFSKLSANLQAKLSSLNGQITQQQRSLSSAQSNASAYSNKASSYQSQATTAYNNYSYYSRLGTKYRSTATSYLNRYNSLNSQAQSARSSASYWQGQVSSINSQIASLNSQKNSAQSSVTSAQNELGRLQRLKAFGDQEIQRKRTLLATLQSEVKNLQTQLDKVNATIALLKTDLTKLQSQYASVAGALPPLSQTQINQLNADISSLNAQISSLSAEITAQQAEITNEATFEKDQSNSAEVAGTQESRTAINNAVRDGVAYVRDNPGKVSIAVVAGTGAVVFCVSTGGIGCVVLGTAATVAGTAATVNGVKVVTTQSDIFGNPVSDADWGRAVAMLPLDIAGIVGGVAGLKAILTARNGAKAAEGLVMIATKGPSEVSATAKAEIVAAARGAGVVARISSIKVSDLKPTHYLTKSATEMQKFVDDIRLNGVKESVKYVVYNGVKYIVDGHHRYYAALKIGLREIPAEEVKLPYLGYLSIDDLSIEGGMPGYWQYIK